MTPTKKTQIEGDVPSQVVTLEEAMEVASATELPVTEVVEDATSASNEEEIKELHAMVPDELGTEAEDTVLINGVTCRVSRLRFREHLALGRILTRSAQFVDWNAFNMNEGGDNLIAMLVSLVSNVPMAENELISLFRKIVYPVDDLNKYQLEQFYQYTNNPELSEVIEVSRIAVRQEKDNWKNIVKTVETVIPLQMAQMAREATKRASG